MTNASELWITCSKGYLRPTAEERQHQAKALNRLEKLVTYISMPVIIVDIENLKQYLKEYIPVSDSVTAKIIKTDESKK